MLDTTFLLAAILECVEARDLALEEAVSSVYEVLCLMGNTHQHSSRERNGAQWRTKVGFGRTMMQALELPWLVKKHILG